MFFFFYCIDTLPVIKKKKSKKSKDVVDEETLGKIQSEIPFFIKPSEKIASIDSSKWPLLLKVSYSRYLLIFYIIYNSNMYISN